MSSTRRARASPRTRYAVHDVMSGETSRWRARPTRCASIPLTIPRTCSMRPRRDHTVAPHAPEASVKPDPIPAAATPPHPVPASDPLWFKRAVFYELLVRAFQDSNDDGVGDFPGLIEHLDYLQWLGVDCIWLLPFNQSPLRDGGYDIATTTTCCPSTATVDDVGGSRRGAPAWHARDHGPRRQPHQRPAPVVQVGALRPDSPYRDWYVWSDSDQRYMDARIIFVDTEPSNWTWDEQAGAYYWHRFFSHQPDLNYDNPGVGRGHARGRVLARPRAWTASASTPCRTSTSARAPTARTCPRRTPSWPSCAQPSTASTPTRCCSPRPTSGPRTSSTTSGPRSDPSAT